MKDSFGNLLARREITVRRRATIAAGLTNPRSPRAAASSSANPVSTRTGCGPPRITQTKKWSVIRSCEGSR